jgi:S-formylglutathione hydrolase FrmB
MGIETSPAHLPAVSALLSLSALAAAGILHGFAPAVVGPDGGTVLVGMFPGGDRPGYVYLPPDFTTSRRYPVVYLLHGMRGSPSEYLYGTGLVDFADQGIASGSVRPFIAVMPAAGPTPAYNGEWAGRWERYLVNDVLPWVDAHLPTIGAPPDRILAGLSAGGYGAADIGIRHPSLFGTIESWGGYFHPLRDGPFKNADQATLSAHDPTLLARTEAGTLRRDRTRFFLSTGPNHSHWFTSTQTTRFRSELEHLGLDTVGFNDPVAKGEWRAQLQQGLSWALASPPAR